MIIPAPLRERAAQIKLLVLDVDGVLTDGRLHYSEHGESFKSFDSKDGLGIRLLLREGISVAVITARSAPALQKRLRDLRVPYAFLGREDKMAALYELLAELHLELSQVTYAGDDILDLPVLRRVGFSITVSDAHALVREEVDWVTSKAGGRAAVREMADGLLEARDRLKQACEDLLETRRTRSAFRIVIPARYGSSRLPGKPLHDIAGKAMIVHVWEKAMAAGAEEVIVATDDKRIAEVIEKAGGHAVMTSPEHQSGTDRIAEVAGSWPDDTLIVNLQGDEPLVPASMLADLAASLDDHRDAGVATMATPIIDPGDIFDRNVVKVVANDEGYALYFSRAPIPWVRDSFGVTGPGSIQLPEETPFYRHLGLYAYRAGTLRRIAGAERAAIEQAESLEQLRALAMGIPIFVKHIDKAPGHGVDTEEDLQRVRTLIESGETKL